MKKLLLTYLLVPLLLCTGQLAAQVATPATQGVNCGGTATINVNVNGALYYATTTGGLVIQDGGGDRALVVTTQSTLTVRAASGGGQVVISLASNPNVEVGRATVSINALQLGQISGTNLSNGLSCIPSTGGGTYSIPNIAGANYVWRITNGGQHTRISSSSGNSVTIESINEGNSSLTVYVFNDCTGDLCAADSRTINIKKTFSLAANEVVGGPACMDASVLGEDNILVYSVKPYLGLYNTTNDYQWSLTAGLEELYRSADGSTISLRVNDPSVDQQVSIVVGSSCNGQNNTLVKVLKSPAPAPTFDSESFCVSDISGTQATFSVTNNPEGKYSYRWILPSNWSAVGTNGPDSTQVTVQFNNTGTGNITVAASNAGCGTKFASFNVNRYPTVAPPIAGTSCVKFGVVAPITYSVQGGNNTYTWEVLPEGTGWIVTTGNGPAIDIIPAYGNIPANGKVTVRATIQGNCGMAPVTSSLDVEIGPAAPGAIIGTNCIANGTTAVTYSVAEVPRNKGYQWTIPPTWSVTGGTNSNSVTVNPNNTDGTLRVLALGCSGTTNSAETILDIEMGPAMPDAITGPSCVKFGTINMQYTIANVPKATGFLWEVPPGWTTTVAPNGLSMTVTATDNTSGEVKVKALGCSTDANSAFRVLPVSIGPPQPDVIAGPACINTPGNQTYSITPPPGSNYTYSWSAPGWTIVGSANGSSVEVTPGTGSTTISVTAVGCDTGANSDARTLAVSVAPAQPGPIDYYVGGDEANVCLGNGANQIVHFSVDEVPGASGYTWTVSPWNTGPSNTTTPGINVVTDATSDAEVSVIARGSVAGCNSEPQTMTLSRSGLEFCITVDPLNSLFKYYVVYPEDIQGGTPTYYEWYPSGVNVPIVAGPEDNAYPARNGTGTIRVDVTDETGCKTSLSIALNNPVGYQECNYTPGFNFAAGRSAAPPAVAADDNEPAASDLPQETVSRLQLFPNPVNDEVNIVVPKEARRNGNLAIYSMTGQQMAAVPSLTKEVKLNVSNYPSGGYFVIITTPAASYYGKMMVKH